MNRMVSILWVLAASALPASAGESRGGVEQSLDRVVNVKLENTKLGDAVQALAKQANTRIVLPPEVVRLTPHGADTTVGVEFSSMPLRQALAELLGPLGLTFAVAGDAIAIGPKEALACLGRAPTWEELDALAELARLQPGTDEAALHTLQAKVQLQVPDADGWQRLAAAIKAAGAGPGDAVLGVACRNLGWVWCVAGTQFIVSSPEQRVQRQLSQPISLRMNYRPLVDVLNALGDRAGVVVRAEPGVLASLPANMQRNFSLNVEQMPLQQVMEKITAFTGLAYALDAQGVVLFRPPTPPGETPAAAHGAPEPAPGADPYVAKIVIPLPGGKSIEWLIRASELPPDLRERREEDLKAAFEQLRGMDGKAGR
ncbi:MAG: STN domain-containing protein [Planctomycetes bacterium]|nr:STN domain-containing protein [Planctomycetota bacterium]